MPNTPPNTSMVSKSDRGAFAGLRVAASRWKARQSRSSSPGASATLNEWLWAAEVRAGGRQWSSRVSRTGGAELWGGSDMLDISSVPQLKELSHLPVLVDPSHAADKAHRVQPLARAAQGRGPMA